MRVRYFVRGVTWRNYIHEITEVQHEEVVLDRFIGKISRIILG